MPERRTLALGDLARVEGEGALHLVVEGDRIVDLRLEIFEPPRLFEAFLRGRSAAELPDLMARICGLCPAAYQMSAVHAIEEAYGVEIHPGTRALRRLYYAGEWIESHLLHMLFLAAPDFLRLDDAFELARSHRAEVERGMKLRGLGNRIMSLLGGRPVNPVGVCIGGFARTPAPSELEALADELRRARGEAEALLRWFASLPVPERPQADLELVSLRHPGEYPMNEGRLVSSLGLDAEPASFEDHFEESQVPHSTALQARLRDRGAYLVGPLARVTLNADRLAPVARAALDSLAPRLPAPDPAASVFARGVEVIQAIDDAVSALDTLEAPPGPAAWSPRAGRGHGATEAPRGLLYVRVETDAAGDVVELKIVPPTAQNQARIERDLRALVPEILTLSEDEARRRCEMVIRDYDPCISCATHFLKLSIERRGAAGAGR